MNVELRQAHEQINLTQAEVAHSLGITETDKAFNQGADALEADWQTYLAHQRKISSPATQSKERIEKIIKQMEVLRDFFANIPWEVQA